MSAASKARGGGGRNRGNRDSSRGNRGNRGSRGNPGNSGTAGRGGRRGRNRGGARGQRVGDAGTSEPPQDRKAEVARVNNAAAKFLGKEDVDDDDEDGIGGDDDDREMCLICCEPLIYVAIGPCNHALVCSTCVIRQRVLYKDRSCSLCKATTDRIIVTSDRARVTWDSWNDFLFGDQCGGRLVAYDACDAFFDTHDEEHLSAVKRLLGFSCGVCSDGMCGSVAQLRAHLMGKHKKMLCGVCVDAGRKFVSEMPRFTKNQLERHNIKGDPAEGLRGHPPCNFCRPKRFYDDEALYHHMTEKHYQCDVCQAMGNGNRFFKDYAMLDRHFGHKHFKCDQPECILKRFIVFRSEIDLQGHMASHHPNVRYNRKIAVSFTVGRGMSGGDGNAIDEPSETMTFSDDFMRRHGGGDRSVSRSRGGGGQGPPPAVIENAFPSLRDSAAAAASGPLSASQLGQQQQQGQRNNPNWAGGLGRGAGQSMPRGRVSIRSEKDFPGLGGGGGSGGGGGGSSASYSMSARLRRQGGGGQHRNRLQTPPSANSESDFPSMIRGPSGGRLGVFRDSDRRHAKQMAKAFQKIDKPRRQIEAIPEGAQIIGKTDSSGGTSSALGNSGDVSTHSSASTWACSRCTLINKGSAHCTACGAAAIYGMRVLKSKKGVGKPTSRKIAAVPLQQPQQQDQQQQSSAAGNESKAALARRIRGILGEKKFPIFQRLCGAYAKQKISAQEYYSSVTRLCSRPELMSFWDGLLSMLPSPALRQPLRLLFQSDAIKRRQEAEGGGQGGGGPGKTQVPAAPTSYIPSSVFQPPSTASTGSKNKKKKKTVRMMSGFEAGPANPASATAKYTAAAARQRNSYNIASASAVQNEIDKWVSSNTIKGGNAQEAYPSLPPRSNSGGSTQLLIKHSAKKKQDERPRQIDAIPVTATILTKKREGIQIVDLRSQKIKAESEAAKAKAEKSDREASQAAAKIGEKVSHRVRSKGNGSDDSDLEERGEDAEEEDRDRVVQVKVQGLVSDVELNGLFGLRGEWNEEKGRFRVVFPEGSGHGARWLRPANFEVVKKMKTKKKKKKKTKKKKKKDVGAGSGGGGGASGWQDASFASTEAAGGANDVGRGSVGSTGNDKRNKKKKRIKMDRQQKKKKSQTGGGYAGAGAGFSVSDKGARGAKRR